MRLTFLGKETQTGGSPTLYGTDRDTYVVQGWKVSGQPSAVEIPQRLLGYLAPGTSLAARLHDTGCGSFILTGAFVTDAQALSQMDVPSHENCVEVGKARAAIEGSTSSGVPVG